MPIIISEFWEEYDAPKNLLSVLPLQQSNFIGFLTIKK
jgi:hypothetical protein